MLNKIDTEYQEGRTLAIEGFNLSNPIESKVYELINAIDKTNDKAAKSKLVKIAKNKPLSFSPSILSYFSDVATSKNYNLKGVASDIVILLSEDNELKLRLAVGACDARPSQIVADYVSDHAECLDPNQIRQVLASLAYRAVPYSLGFERPYVDKAPLLAVAMAHPMELTKILLEYLDSGNLGDYSTAARIVTTVASKISEIAKATLEPLLTVYLNISVPDTYFDQSELKETVNQLAQAALVLYDLNPEDSETVIRACKPNHEEDRQQRLAELYQSVLDFDQNEKVAKNTLARRIAFKRLLDIAVQNVFEPRYRHLIEFISKPDKWLQSVAMSSFGELQRKAIEVSKSDEEIAKEISKDRLLDELSPELKQIQINYCIEQCGSLRDGLVGWMILLSSEEGIEGIRRILQLYQEFRENNSVFRNTFLKQMTCLITKDTDSINEVLPFLHEGLLSTDPIVRGYTVQAFKYVGERVRRRLPDSIFETLIDSLRDPHPFVHKSVVHYVLGPKQLPEKLTDKVKLNLLILLSAYKYANHQPEFIAQCLDKLANSLTLEEIKDVWGQAIPYFMENLPDRHLNQTIIRLPDRMRFAKGYSRVIAKSLKNDYYSGDLDKRICRLLFHSPRGNLTECVDNVFEAGKRRGTDNPFEIATPIAILSLAGAYAKARELCDVFLASIPNTIENQVQRMFLQSLQIILLTEVEPPNTTEEWEHLELRWKRHLGTVDRFGDAALNETSSISRELMQEQIWMFGKSRNWFREVFSSRLEGLRAIRSRDYDLAKRTANKLEVFARVYREYSPSRDLIALSKAYQSLSKLYKWLDSIRNSKKKPEKHLESAQFIAEETLASELGQCTEEFNLLFRDITAVTDLEGVIGVENKLTIIPVPLSVSIPPNVEGSSNSISLESKPDYDEKIGVVSFWLNGREAKTLNILAPKILHDVVMEINVPYWPMNAKNLILEATSTTNSKYFDLPSFQFSRPIDDAIEQTFKLERKMVLKVEQDLNAEPIELKFTASYDDPQGESLDLTGQDTLRIFSSSKKPATVLDELEKIEQRIGSVSGNNKIIEIFVQLQKNYEVPKEDTLAVLAVLDNLMKLANLSLRYGFFAVGTKEEIFQKEVLRNMQQIPKLADDLHEQVKTGNGIVDLMFRGIPIELKAESERTVTNGTSTGFVKQAAQYAVTLGKKVGILCILDSSEKSEVSKPIDALIQIDEAHWSKSKVVIIEVIIQGGLPRPSDLNRSYNCD